MKCVCVVDGQGGGIGAALIKCFRKQFGEAIEIIALGSNAIATAQMLRAGANRGASGENAVCRALTAADCILGPISITWPNAMLGEVTPKMAEAVMDSPALKILLPLTQERTVIVGWNREPLPHLVEASVTFFMEEIKNV